MLPRNRTKKSFIVYVCLLFLLSFTIKSKNCVASPFYAKVVSVIDGDSILVKKAEQKIQIRLWGIDAPEKNQPFSYEAKRLTRKLVLNTEIRVVPIEWDDYGRLVAHVFKDRKSISEQLVDSGLAWVHVYYCRKKICRDWKIIQKTAREEKRGLWAEDNPISPWKWKRKYKR